MPGHAAAMLLALWMAGLVSPTTAMGWPQNKGGRSWGWQSNPSQQWRQNHGAEQLLRIEVSHTDSDKKDQRHRREEGRRHHRSHSSKKREFSVSSSASSSPSPRDRRKKKSKKDKHPKHKSDRECRLEQELETLRAEKAAREAAELKDKLHRDMDLQVQAIRADLQGQLDTKLESLKGKAATRSGFMPDKSGKHANKPEATEDLVPLSPSEKMAVYHALGGYEPVKDCADWSDLEKQLAAEEEERLRSLVRLVQKKGGLPRTAEAMASKILVVMKASLAEFSRSSAQ